MTELKKLVGAYCGSEEFNEVVELAYVFYRASPSIETFDALMRAFGATVLESCITDGMQQKESTDLADQLFKGVK